MQRRQRGRQEKKAERAKQTPCEARIVRQAIDVIAPGS